MIPETLPRPACARCGRPGDGRPVSSAVKIPASAALAFVHGGMWVHEELSRPFCARCRRLVSFVALAAAAVVLSAAAFGVALWLKGPSR